MKTQAKLIVLVVLIVFVSLFGSGCFFLDFLFGEKDKEDIAPPGEKEEKKEEPGKLDIKEEEEDKRETTFYLLDEYSAKLVPKAREISRVEGIAQKTLSKMVRDQDIKEYWADCELKPVLPQGTKVIGMAIDDEGIARVNFSEDFLEFEDNMDQVLNAVVYTLTEFDTIEKVEFMVEGMLLENLPEGAELEGVMEPTGLNAEVPVMAGEEDGTPLTLFFVAEKEENTYYVPVTRVVSPSEDLEGEALAELIRGPGADSTLKSYVSSQVSLNDIDIKQDKMVIDVSNLAKEEDKLEQAAKQVIYTLEEFKTIDSVELTIDGEQLVLD